MVKKLCITLQALLKKQENLLMAKKMASGVCMIQKVRKQIVLDIKIQFKNEEYRCCMLSNFWW